MPGVCLKKIKPFGFLLLICHTAYFLWYSFHIGFLSRGVAGDDLDFIIPVLMLDLPVALILMLFEYLAPLRMIIE